MRPLVLASKSAARAQILQQAGVAFLTASSGVDEDKVKAKELAAGRPPAEIAMALAEAKALQASAAHEGLVIGADQTLEFEQRLFDKAADLGQARTQLAAFRGKTHRLHSAVALAESGRIIWRELKSADLTMRRFSDGFLDGYMARNADAALTCVGGYEWEGEGVQLFEAIDGDYFTILGLPLLGLLAELRRLGALQP